MHESSRVEFHWPNRRVNDFGGRGPIIINVIMRLYFQHQLMLFILIT